MQTKQRWMRCGLFAVTLAWCAGLQPAEAQYTVLHNFAGGAGDGCNPHGSLTLSGSTLYGTASAGGPNFGGTVFRIFTSGTSYANLLNFLQPGIGPPGSSCSPRGSLLLSVSTLHGMTKYGGSNNMGTLFALALSPLSTASHLSSSQRCYFTYAGSSDFAFIYDYSAGLQESVTPGMISYDTYLTFNAQNPVAITTHVAYVYNASLARYTEAMAFLEQNL